MKHLGPSSSGGMKHIQNFMKIRRGYENFYMFHFQHRGMKHVLGYGKTCHCISLSSLFWLFPIATDTVFPLTFGAHNWNPASFVKGTCYNITSLSFCFDCFQWQLTLLVPMSRSVDPVCISSCMAGLMFRQWSTTKEDTPINTAA